MAKKKDTGEMIEFVNPFCKEEESPLALMLKRGWMEDGLVHDATGTWEDSLFFGTEEEDFFPLLKEKRYEEAAGLFRKQLDSDNETVWQCLVDLYAGLSRTYVEFQQADEYVCEMARLFPNTMPKETKDLYRQVIVNRKKLVPKGKKTLHIYEILDRFLRYLSHRGVLHLWPHVTQEEEENAYRKFPRLKETEMILAVYSWKRLGIAGMMVFTNAGVWTNEKIIGGLFADHSNCEVRYDSINAVSMKRDRSSIDLKTSDGVVNLRMPGGTQTDLIVRMFKKLSAA
ncbi:MAG: hypothetical protein IKS37_06385 [Solobacterium sp.]|nr:hypothetical protein [Solobacterium sp.]